MKRKVFARLIGARMVRFVVVRIAWVESGRAGILRGTESVRERAVGRSPEKSVVRRARSPIDRRMLVEAEFFFSRSAG